MAFIVESMHLEASIKIVSVQNPLVVKASKEYKRRREIMKPVVTVHRKIPVYCDSKNSCIKDFIL